MNYRQLEEVIAEYQALHGMNQAQATRAIFAIAALAMATHVPHDLLPGLRAAATKALNPDSQLAELAPTRVAAWQHLDSKNGNSTTVEDSTDRALRLLTTIAWDDEMPDTDRDLALEFVLNLINAEQSLVALLC